MLCNRLANSIWDVFAVYDGRVVKGLAIIAKDPSLEPSSPPQTPRLVADHIDGSAASPGFKFNVKVTLRT